MIMDRTIICGLSEDEISTLLEPYGFTRAHSHEIAVNLYKRKFIDFSDFTGIPERLREHLKIHFSTGLFSFRESHLSEDKSVKYLFRTDDGKEFETVYIPDGKRHTLCVSTQSGCRMGCSFCVSGSYGFHGNLMASEILNQLLSIPQSGLITHVVFMGMGEPMDNMVNLFRSCMALTSQWGFAISPRNITVSTVGIKEAVEEFIEKSDCNLTLSLHSPFKEERRSFIPAENRSGFEEIVTVFKNAKLRKGRRLSVAYVMIDGINDTEDHLRALKSLFRNTLIRVNLLPYHSVNNDTMASSPHQRIQYFKHNLVVEGISASIRKSRGQDIAAACGLLAAGLDKKS